MNDMQAYYTRQKLSRYQRRLVSSLVIVGAVILLRGCIETAAYASELVTIYDYSDEKPLDIDVLGMNKTANYEYNRVYGAK